MFGSHASALSLLRPPGMGAFRCLWVRLVKPGSGDRSPSVGHRRRTPVVLVVGFCQAWGDSANQRGGYGSCWLRRCGGLLRVGCWEQRGGWELDYCEALVRSLAFLRGTEGG